MWRKTVSHILTLISVLALRRAAAVMTSLNPESLRKKWKNEKGSRPRLGVKQCGGSKVNKRNQRSRRGRIKRRNGSEKVGECEISWDGGKNALRAYFSKTFYPTTGLTANIASVSEHSSDYGKSPGRENLHHTHTHRHTHTCTQTWTLNLRLSLRSITSTSSIIGFHFHLCPPLGSPLLVDCTQTSSPTTSSLASHAFLLPSPPANRHFMPHSRVLNWSTITGWFLLQSCSLDLLTNVGLSALLCSHHYKLDSDSWGPVTGETRPEEEMS